MKKQTLIAAALLTASFGFAQKKELKTAEKALKDNNYAEAKVALSQAQSMMGSMDDKLKSKYHLLSAQAFYANGAGNDADVTKAIELLNSVGSDDAKDAQALKEAMVKKFLEKGNEQYEAKKYGMAALNFEKIYRVFPQDTVFLYNAAISADIAQETDKAIGYYNELKNVGYTGIETEYYAFNTETNQEEKLNSQSERDLYLRSGKYIKPTDKNTESKRPEIVKRIAQLYVAQGKDDMAIKAIKEARAQNPKDVNLIITEANLYYKLEDVARYKQLTEEAIQLDPNNADLFYNLGVISADADDVENAEKYYKKTLEINPNYINAKMNLAALILSGEQAIIDQMNSLGSSAADNKKYDELKEKRLGLYRKSIPYLEGVLSQEPDNDAAIKTLLSMYSAIGEDAKAKAMSEKLDSLKN